MYLSNAFSSLLLLFQSPRTIFGAQHALRQSTCVAQSQPNPIASIYPGNATGTLNGTLAVLPIPLTLARQLIPSQYQILESAYREILPEFPADQYPAVVQGVHDHDVRFMNYSIPDFSRAGIEFPFIDVLSDGYTSFRWAPSLLMTATNEVAISGAVNYGTNVSPAIFNPECDAYQTASSSAPSGTTIFNASSVAPGDAYLSSTFASAEKSPYPIEFFKNFTNQPSFADGKTCDNMIRLFNTSLSAPPYEPINVQGSVKAKLSPFEGEKEWSNVYGVRLDTAFIENNYLDCQSLQGYSGTGPGD